MLLKFLLAFPHRAQHLPPFFVKKQQQLIMIGLAAFRSAIAHFSCLFVEESKKSIQYHWIYSFLIHLADFEISDPNDHTQN